MIEHLHPINPEIRKLKNISQNLLKGEVYIFPTDTVYAIVADSQSKEGVEKLYSLKKLGKNHFLSVLCRDISEASSLIEFLPNNAFRAMKRLTPGPFTFILKANKMVPRVTISDKKAKTIGVRIPDHLYIQELLKIHPNTLTSTSVLTDDEYIIDIDRLEELYGNRVHGIIDGGIVDVEMSTILDFTQEEMEIVREGKGAELLSQI